jgi:thiamine-monophosphate kinase
VLGVANSAIDISDGLVADLGHICERSRVAATIELARVPVSPVMRRHLDHPLAIAARLAGGDDYELCFTASHRARARIERIGRRLRARGHPHRGCIESGDACRRRNRARPPWPAAAALMRL